MNSERGKIYFCKHCKLLVEVLGENGVNPVCCGEPMTLQKENVTDGAKEKHVPVAESNGKGGTIVKVGSVAHPMLPEHYIEWIEIVNGDYVNRKYLKPGQAPEAEFFVPYSGELTIREYCNIHGLWKSGK